MTYGNRPDYQLAEKMKSRFSGRGAAVSGMRASTTSELMKRAQMGGDPSVNCSELDFRNRAAQTAAGGYRPMYANYANANSTGSYGQRRTPDARSGHTNRTGPNPSRTGDTEARRTSHPGSNASGQKPQKETKARKTPVHVPENEEITEVKVHGRKLTPMFAVGLVIGTMMIMSIVLLVAIPPTN